MYNVALIGIGNISLNFDCDINKKTVLSHAKALYNDKRFHLKYCIDIDKSNENKIKKLFPNTLFDTNINEIIDKQDIDIVVIATPTSTHFEILEQFKLNPNIKYFLIEKPLFADNKHFDLLSSTLKEKIIINYIRIFEPHIQKLKNKIEISEYSQIQKIVLNYTKGIKNNGSHFISLINYLFNNPRIENIKILSIQKGLENDSTLDLVATLKYKNNIIPFYMLGFNHNKYTLFDIDFYFNTSKIRLEDTSQTLLEYKVQQDSTYPQYTTLLKNENINLNFDIIMKYPYEYIYNLLNKNIEPINFIKHEKSTNDFYKNLQKEINNG